MRVPFLSRGKSTPSAESFYIPIIAIGLIDPIMRVKAARRYQITIPQEVREEAGIKMGDTVDVRTQDGKVIVEKLGANWEEVVNQTKGAWKSHPAFKGMKNSIEVTNWLRQKSKRKRV